MIQITPFNNLTLLITLDRDFKTEDELKDKRKLF